MMLKFTPLEFETVLSSFASDEEAVLKFTPLEFETLYSRQSYLFS